MAQSLLSFKTGLPGAYSHYPLTFLAGCFFRKGGFRLLVEKSVRFLHEKKPVASRLFFTAPYVADARAKFNTL